ncbi:DUF732 domain-containing protein [Mycolicibacterium hodleri]|uniref:DUF732 domain-containing protein n=1 Tax=Mycolicibacterium hodleri TaxID=49897 RepID=A0A502EHP8_9MYCO|nr:DUF732 domain-containing protein [Mycolicibacterium hodleri]TPG35861.1 DUF732 domain-containing protein [Mycolicibacterium hodleri]
MKPLLAVTLALGIAVGAAPTAAASQGHYLEQLQPRITYLTSEQLLTEGYKVCRYVGVGRPTADAIPMVMNDLRVTVSAAMDIIPAAVEELDC